MKILLKKTRPASYPSFFWQDFFFFPFPSLFIFEKPAIILLISAMRGTRMTAQWCKSNLLLFAILDDEEEERVNLGFSTPPNNFLASPKNKTQKIYAGPPPTSFACLHANFLHLFFFLSCVGSTSRREWGRRERCPKRRAKCKQTIIKTRQGKNLFFKILGEMGL